MNAKLIPWVSGAIVTLGWLLYLLIGPKVLEIYGYIAVSIALAFFLSLVMWMAGELLGCWNE